jgi:predicted nucleic acid-binding protein
VISAVDSSIIFDILLDEPGFGVASMGLLRRARQEGGLIACDVVWAEVTARFAAADDAVTAMERLGVAFQAISREVATSAGQSWREYRRRGGPRTRITSDFLIGAHALAAADRLVTRDRGFYRTYFSGLEILDPSV